MAIRIIDKNHVKQWVVKHSAITNPHGKKWWFCSVTLGYDYSEKGETIELAYQAMTNFIYTSPLIMCRLSDLDSFRRIVKQ